MDSRDGNKERKVDKIWGTDKMYKTDSMMMYKTVV